MSENLPGAPAKLGRRIANALTGQLAKRSFDNAIFQRMKGNDYNPSARL